MNRLFAICAFAALLESVATGQVVNPEWMKPASWPELVRTAPFPVDSREGRLERLFKEYHNASLKELSDRYVFWIQGIGSLRDVATTADEYVAARIRVAPADEEAIRKLHFEFAKSIEMQSSEIAKVRRGAAANLDHVFSKGYRLRIEIEFVELANKSKK